jgi:hypothetical protein
MPVLDSKNKFISSQIFLFMVCNIRCWNTLTISSKRHSDSEQSVLFYVVKKRPHLTYISPPEAEICKF